MLHRLLSRHSPIRLLTLVSPKTPLSLNPYPIPTLINPNPSFFISRHFSNNNNGGDTSDLWRLSAAETDSSSIDSIFGDDDKGIEKPDVFDEEREREEAWRLGGGEKGDEDVFGLRGGEEREREAGGKEAWRLGGEKGDDNDVFGLGGGEEERESKGRVERESEGLEEERESEEKAWRLGGEKGDDDVFDLGEEEEKRVEVKESDGREEREAEVRKKIEDEKKLEEEAKVLSDVLKGPNRAFGDLISASGITEEMLDSLMALKDLSGVQGLPPLSEIEDMRYQNSTRKSSRAEIERQKQEEVAKARVRQVDNKGRAYGTGRRKCSVARVWIQPGEGKFVVNDKEFDVYFPMLDHRAALLRPFSETKTLGLWNVSCTVKGGGVSGQVGAVQLGISRALQNWEPNLRPPLRAVGFLTRDARVVERKKPGKAKARKSFQWVKR